MEASVRQERQACPRFRPAWDNRHLCQSCGQLAERHSTEAIEAGKRTPEERAEKIRGEVEGLLRSMREALDGWSREPSIKGQARWAQRVAAYASAIELAADEVTVIEFGAQFRHMP